MICPECKSYLILSNKILLSDPPQYQYKCHKCDKRYLKTEGQDNLHLHFDKKYGGD